MSRIDGLSDQLCRARAFFKFDLKSGYDQLKIRNDDVSRLKTRHGHYEFFVMS